MVWTQILQSGSEGPTLISCAAWLLRVVLHSYLLFAPSWRTIVSKSRILDPGVLAVACCLLCSLEHTVHLIEVDITEQWGDHSALRDAAATIRFQHDLHQVHHVIIVDSLRHFDQQQVVPNVVKIAAQVEIYDARLAPIDRLGYAVNSFLS